MSLERRAAYVSAGLKPLIVLAGMAFGVALLLACYSSAARDPISSAREVRGALQACWVAPADGAAQQISVRFSFNQDGRAVGQPLITYVNPQPSEQARAAVREAVTQAVARCEPLPLSDDFRKVVSVRPITVRFGEGWPRGGRPAGGSGR
jgi:hypothetical protein